MTPEQRAEALRLAAQLNIRQITSIKDQHAAADLLTALAAQPVQAEPVAWRYLPSEVWGYYVLTQDAETASLARANGIAVQPLYTAPSPAPAARVGLTDEQVWKDDEIMSRNAVGGLPMHELMRLVRAIEHAHNIPAPKP